MDFKSKSAEKIKRLIEKGVKIPSPETIYIGDEVNLSQISEKGVTLYPGCRIYGEKTVLSSGCTLGYEAPVTVENCQLGPKVELKGGFFSKSVFLEKSNMGMGAHVREGCLLEEEAGGAHCVGLKQTILFPFVTLGSLINFCDCFMAGGTSRSNHSEVGSSYIHFNFTPDADKTTPSLLGDVPRGVMLNQPPIFLGGQGGIIGPVRMGFGNVVAAGSILRHDYLHDHQLIFEKDPGSGMKNYVPSAYPNLGRIVENNILYLANLVALEEWYKHVRKHFLQAQPLGSFLFTGAMEQLASAKKERLKRLKSMAGKAGTAAIKQRSQKYFKGRREFHEQIGYIEDLFNGDIADEREATKKLRNAFLKKLEKAVTKNQKRYIETIQALPADISSQGIAWLNDIVYDLGETVSRALPSLGLLKKYHKNKKEK